MPLTQQQFKAARDAGFSTEQIIGFENKRNNQPDNLSNFSNADSQINQRPSAIQDLVRNPPTMQHPLGAALRTLQGAGELYQGVPASIALDLQRGRPQDIGQNLGKVLTGQRPAQYGDVYKGAGAGNTEQSIRGGIGRGMAIAAPTAGLATDIVTSPGGAEGAIGLTKGLYGIGKAGINAVGKGIGNTLARAKASYITDEVAPKAHQIFQENVQKFTPEIENYARTELKIPEQAVETIKKNGVQNITATRQALGDSTDQIAQKIQAGIDAKSKAVEDAYGKVFSQQPGSAVIHLNKTKMAMGALLRKAGYLDSSNKATAIATNDIAENSALRRMMGFYQSIGANQENKIAAVNPLQWNIFRDALTKARTGSKGLSSEVTGILDSLHADAEKAGFKGISQARSLAKADFQAQDNILKESLIKEGKLKNYYGMSEAEKRQLGEIEKYTGTNFVDELKKVSAGKYLDKIQEGKTLDDFVRDLNTAQNRAQTNFISKKYAKVLGQENTNKIIAEVVKSRQLGAAKKIVGWGAGLGATEEIGKRVMRGHF